MGHLSFCMNQPASTKMFRDVSYTQVCIQHGILTATAGYEPKDEEKSKEKVNNKPLECVALLLQASKGTNSS